MSISLVCWEWFNVISNNFNTVIDDPFDKSLNKYSNSKYSLIKSDNIEIMKLKHFCGFGRPKLLCNKTKQIKLFNDDDASLLILYKFEPCYSKMLYFSNFELDLFKPIDQFPEINDFKRFALSHYQGNEIPQLIKNYNQNNRIIREFHSYLSLSIFPFKQLYDSNNRLLSSNINKVILDTTTIENIYYILFSCPNIIE
ncbi:hypothetical protein ACTA71_003261 [Dictyostelium dimigraforme]